MKSAINSLILLCGIFLLVTIGCKEEEPMIDPDIAARTCENGSLCGKGAVCTTSICGCPKETFYTGGVVLNYPISDSVCKEIQKYHYKLSYWAGSDLKLFDYWKIVEVSRDYRSTNDTLGLNFFMIKTPKQGGYSESIIQPYTLIFNKTGFNAETKTTYAEPFPKFTGPFSFFIKGYSWNDCEVEYSSDTLKLTVDFYNDKVEKFETVKLIYERVGS